jgi:hypothetical protein
LTINSHTALAKSPSHWRDEAPTPVIIYVYFQIRLAIILPPVRKRATTRSLDGRSLGSRG